MSNDIPDYEVLHSLSQHEQKLGDLPLSALRWQEYNLQSMKISLKEVKCEDSNIAQKFKLDFDPNGNGEIPVNSHVLNRIGGFVQMMSLSSHPIPMAGPITNQNMRLLGYLDVPQVDQHTVRQTEAYTLTQTHHRDRETTWTGIYEFTQEPIGRNVKPTLHVLFDVQLVLVEVIPIDDRTSSGEEGEQEDEKLENKKSHRSSHHHHHHHHQSRSHQSRSHHSPHHHPPSSSSSSHHHEHHSSSSRHHESPHTGRKSEHDRERRDKDVDQDRRKEKREKKDEGL